MEIQEENLRRIDVKAEPLQEIGKWEKFRNVHHQSLEGPQSFRV